MDLFEEAWGELSPVQKKAASWEKGPLLLLAGPGSGKTRVLTCRVARVLREFPEESFRVLALTFTNKAADEMRGRIQTYVPEGDSRLFVGTFHAYCAEVLRQSGGALGIPSGFQIYGEDEDRKEILDEALQSIAHELGGIRESDRRSLRLIDLLQQSLKLPGAADSAVDSGGGETRIARIYRAYSDTLESHKALDYNSLILRAYELFTEYPKLAERQRLVYRYVCIDEFQDTNMSQYRLLQQLAPPPDSNLFAVADDDQVIYQWNGADYRRLDEFSRQYKPEALQLPLNYRCPSEVVELSNRLISHNFGRFRNKSPQAAIRPPSPSPVITILPVFPDFEAEAESLATTIANGAPIASVCMLARRQALLGPLKEALTKKGVESIILQRKAEFETPPLVWLHSSLRLAADRQDYESLRALSGAFGALTGINSDSKVVDAVATAHGRDLFSAWQDVAGESYAGLEFSRVLNQMSRLGNHLQVGEFVRSSREWLQTLEMRGPSGSARTNSETGNLVADEWSAWSSLYREITSALGREPDLDTLLQELDMRSKESTPSSSSVHLMTIHGSKGREYRHVFLVGLVEDELPSYYGRLKGDQSPEMEEERRTCYVAVTRTSSRLTLSLSQVYFGWARNPSRFLAEMGLVAQ